MKTQNTQSINSAATFAAYVQAVTRYSPKLLVNRYQSELMSMFQCGVKPIGAAVHIYCKHQSIGGK